MADHTIAHDRGDCAVRLDSVDEALAAIRAGRVAIVVDDEDEVVNDDGSMMRAPGLRQFADEHGLPMISIGQLAEHRLRTEPGVRQDSTTMLPTAYGRFQAHSYTSVADGRDQLVLTLGEVTERSGALVRVHSECLTGDVLGSQRCDCGEQLSDSLRRIGEVGAGVLIYLRGHEGRGASTRWSLSASWSGAGHCTSTTSVRRLPTA